jgi:hypothetical protein
VPGAAINSGTYKNASASWVQGLNVMTAEAEALKWAQESNKYVCSNVLSRGLDYVENTDLGEEYTSESEPVVDLQMAKQGYRLAKWLDAIAASVS